MTGQSEDADPPDGLTPKSLVRAMQAFSEALERHRGTVNRLNVYPVPDGDTGTNMALTLESVVRALDGLDLADLDGDAMGAACRAIASGSLMGARGNSGVILCQILRGISGTFAPFRVVRAHEAAVALAEGSQAARAGVMRPVEGTMLTVAADAAAAARELDGAEGTSLLAVFEAARAAAVASLWRTPDLLPVLAQAGVVDAGGAGLVLLYDAFLHVMDGRPLPDELPLPPEVADQVGSRWPPRARRDGRGAIVAAPPTALRRVRVTIAATGFRQRRRCRLRDLRYEVMYFLEAPDETLGGLQGRLGRHRRLDRRRRRRRPVELPHPHRRHRRRDRGGPGRGAAPRDPRHRPARPGRGGVLGAACRRARRCGGRAPRSRPR